MKNKLLLLLAISPIVAFGCRSIDPIEDVCINDQPFYEIGYVPGSVNIKVSEALAEEIGEAGTISSLPGSNVERLFLHGGRFEERMRREGLHLWYKVSFDETTTLTKANNTLSSVDGVDFIEFQPRTVINDEAAPFNDPNLSKQWHYWNKGNAVNGMKAGCDINVMPLWQRGIVGSDNVIVAVIDEGVDYNHEDLHDNMWTNPETEPKVTYGYNFDAGSDLVTPCDHGSHVAGTISAVNNNGIGVSGVAGGDAAKGIKGVRIMSCQILSSLADGMGDAAGALVWAANHGAVIAQNSWGYPLEQNPNITDTPQAVKTAIDYFNKYAGCDNDGNQLPDSPMKGGVVFFSSGNEALDKGYPSSYKGCISVSAVAGDYTPAYYTNYGDWVDIAAPGGDSKKGHEITSTIANNSYGRMQGTSMACPHVSGVAALIISEFGGQGFTRDMCIDRLLNTVTPLNTDIPIGKGLVNAQEALAHYGEYLPYNAEYAGYEAESATSLVFNFIVPELNYDVRCRKLNVYLNDKKFSQPSGICKTIDLVSFNAGETVSVRFDGLEMDTEYFVSSVGEDALGNESAMSANVSVRTVANLPPVIEALGVTEFTMKRFMTRTLEFSVYDPDKNLKDVSYSAATEGESFVEKDGKYILTITGPQTEPGSYTSTIEAVDDFGQSTALDINFTIEKNQAPAGKDIENQIIIGSQQSIEINLGNYFSHPDGDELVFTATVSGEPVVSTNVMNASRKMTVRSNSLGYNDITVTATDSFGLTAKSTFKVAALAGNGYEVYPNPVTDGKLYVRGAREGSIDLSVVNSNGAVVRKENVANNPFEPYCMNVSDLAAGRYTVNVSGSGDSTSITVVIF